MAKREMRATERRGRWRDLDRRPALGIVRAMDREEAIVPKVVARAAGAIAAAADAAAAALKAGRRVFYIGAGTSGRLAVLDASECPPTFGADPREVTAIIAGGDRALRHSIEGAEDDARAGWRSLRAAGIGAGDVLIGISASGTTPYVAGALREARRRRIRTVAIAANRGSPIARIAEIAIEIEVGPEVIAGSTRLKAGTATKMVLNRISTAAMVRLGRVRGNVMVDVKPRSRKLVERATRIIAEEGGVSRAQAARFLARLGSARKALDAIAAGAARPRGRRRR